MPLPKQYSDCAPGCGCTDGCAVQLAEAAEREACAKICDEFDAINDDGHPVRPEGTVQGAETIARVIRART